MAQQMMPKGPQGLPATELSQFEVCFRVSNLLGRVLANRCASAPVGGAGGAVRIEAPQVLAAERPFV